MFCVCVVLKTPYFLLSPILQHEGMANQRQNVLMTVRASSAHGMSSKKIWKKYDVLSMWGNIHPQWRLLQQHLETKGPGWYPRSEREERLFTNRSNPPGDDMKDELRTDGDPIAWRAWSTAQNQLRQQRQPAPPLEFPGEQGMFIDMYAQVREEEQVISAQFTRNQQDVSMRRRKKRKQVEDGALIV